MRRFATSLIPILLLLSLPAYAWPPHRGGGWGRRPAYGYRAPAYRRPVVRSPYHRYPSPYRPYPVLRYGPSLGWGPVYTTPPIVGPSVVYAPAPPVYVVQPRVRVVRPAPIYEEAQPDEEQGSSCPYQEQDPGPAPRRAAPGEELYDTGEADDAYDDQGAYPRDDVRDRDADSDNLESWGRDPSAPDEPAPGRPSQAPRYQAPQNQAHQPLTQAPQFEQAPAAQPSAAADGEVSLDAVEAEVLRLTNVERLRAGLLPVTYEPRLAEAARLHSEEMAAKGYFSHDSPTAGHHSFTDRFAKAGITRFERASENIAMGTFEPKDAAQELVQMWMNSEGHRKNILDPDVRLLGVGTATNDKGELYGTQDFSRVAEPEQAAQPDDEAPRPHMDL